MLPTTDSQLAARRILTVTEEELQRLILDMHDGPVQQLFAAQSQLRAVQMQRQAGETISPAEYDRTLARISRLLEEALEEIRHFLGTFRPPDFARRHLVDILQGLLWHYEMTTGCQVDFLPPDEELAAFDVSLPAKIALYRICQEALSNSFRHAGVNRQRVGLQRDGRFLILTVQDLGKGFIPPSLTDPTLSGSHIGLRGMHDRIALVGGDLQVHSAPGQGTRITARLPIDQ